VINEERALQWLRRGAQPTEAVERLLSKLGIKERVKVSEDIPPHPEEVE
jgi:ribosomal protein S16